MMRTLRRRLRLVLLRTFARFTQPPGSPLQGSGRKRSRILIIRPDHLGDLLFITPALRLLRQRYPEAHVTALVGPWGAPVLAGNPDLDQIKTLAFPGFSRQAKPSLWQPYLLARRWAHRLRADYDLAIVLRFDHWWGALLAYLAGIPCRVGYAVPEVAPFLNCALPYTPGRHEVEQNLVLVHWDQVRTSQPDHTLPISSAQRHPLGYHVPEQVTGGVKAVLRNSHPIGIHPGAGAKIKLWRTAGWAAVADTLAKETGSQILFTGSQAERRLCLEIAEQMNTEAWVMAGETTLDQLAATLGECQLVLGPDSGPLHLAVAMGTPTVHLYGPVDATTFGPWGVPENHRVVISDWPCVPCNRLDYDPEEIADHPCVREIGVEEVLTAARELVRD